ncbi:hypothetical protein [Actinoplanes sp. NPDC051859]|uniref:hypothetical protein n=1 Tax=Actinoplanes sp. NPDC051859 TaxID=3363909 RepID=UPI0037B8D949
MTQEFEVTTEGLRAWAEKLIRAGDRLHADPLPPIPGPPWSASAAGTGAATAAQHTLAAIADDLIATARAAAATAGAYDDTDNRVADRFRALR